MIEVMAVVDLQFGSTGKGQICGTIAHHWNPDTVATAWGPNAGHTFRKGGKTWVHRMLSVGALAPSVEDILIGPGSVVDLPRLAEEIHLAQDLLHGKHLVIHPQAVILRSHHSAAEEALVKIGSTMKGTAEAAIEKMRRDVAQTPTAGLSNWMVHDNLEKSLYEAQMSLAVSSKQYDEAIDASDKLLLEGAQGYSLGIHTDFYPYVTSRDVSTAQLLADCRIPFPRRRDRFRVMGVCRTYPIRVANRYNDLGHQIGTSGPCYPDQQEIQWGEIGREPELTTVTKLPRRIFTFSHRQVAEAARVCGVNTVALTFCDYLPDNGVMQTMINDIDMTLPGAARVRLLSFGPSMEDVKTWDSMVHEASEAMPGDLEDW
jgi:adenylosuccinate synthase